MRKEEGTLGHLLVLLNQGALIPNQGQAMGVRHPGAQSETPLGCNSRVTGFLSPRNYHCITITMQAVSNPRSVMGKLRLL